MTTCTDLEMFGRPTTDADAYRQFRRDLYLYARDLERAFDQGVKVQALADLPPTLGGRPELVADLMRVQLAIGSVMAWAWSVPATPGDAPVMSGSPVSPPPDPSAENSAKQPSEATT